MEAFRKAMERRRRRAFWEATVAMCALMTSSSEKVGLSERVRIDRIIDKLPGADVFDASEFVQLFETFVKDYRINPESARERVFETVRKVSEDEDQAGFFIQTAEILSDPKSPAYDAQVRLIEALRRELGITADAIKTPIPKTVDAFAVKEQPEHPLILEPRAEVRMRGAQSIDTVNRDVMPSREGAATKMGVGLPQVPSSADNISESTVERGEKATMPDSDSIFVLFGRGKAGTVDALRAYNDRSHAEADRALAAKLAPNDCTITPVHRFASGPIGMASADEAPRAYILCHEKPGSTVEGLRSYKLAHRAELDLKFVESISDDRFWIAPVDLISD